MHDFSTNICNYINKGWIAHWKSPIRSFAEEHDVDEKTIRQIADSKNTPLRIGIYTLHKMYVARDLTLEDFLG